MEYYLRTPCLRVGGGSMEMKKIIANKTELIIICWFLLCCSVCFFEPQTILRIFKLGDKIIGIPILSFIFGYLIFNFLKNVFKIKQIKNIKEILSSIFLFFCGSWVFFCTSLMLYQLIFNH